MGPVHGLVRRGTRGSGKSASADVQEGAGRGVSRSQ